MEFKSIEYFIEACKHKSLTEAADSLYLSQQALSRSIRNLEDELKCKLFIRTSKGIELTTTGHYLYNQFRPVIMNFNDTVSRTIMHLGNLPQKLSFCCGFGSIQYIASETLMSFVEQYPNVELDMIELSSIHCEEYIHRDKHKFGMMIAPEWIHKQKHNYIPLKTEPAYLYVHKDNPLAACESISFSVLKNERVLALGKSSYYMEIISKAVEAYNFTVEPFFETSNVTGLCQLVEKGKGVFLSSHQLFDKSVLKNVVLVPFIERTADYCLAFVFQDYDALDPIAQKFIQFIIDNFEGTA